MVHDMEWQWVSRGLVPQHVSVLQGCLVIKYRYVYKAGENFHVLAPYEYFEYNGERFYRPEDVDRLNMEIERKLVSDMLEKLLP